MSGLVVVVLLLGPAQTISGKYVPRLPAALPDPLPSDVDALSRLIESGHETPRLFAALGEALRERGDLGLAYRSFDRAHRGGHPDPRWLQERMDTCGRVPDAVIREEEAEARIWTDALESYRRTGETDLEPFYDRYGRPEDSLADVVRRRRISFAGGVAGILVGVCFAAAARRVPRSAALVPLLIGALCLLLGNAGILHWGGAFALLGAAAVLLLGRGRVP